MQLQVLGPVEVAFEGRRTNVASERQRTILAALLAARGEVVSAGRLIDGLWGPRPPPSAPKTLQSHVSKLRRSLTSLGHPGDAVVVTGPDGYRVDLTLGELDAVRFEELVDEARLRRAVTPEEAVDLLTEAHDLWRGPAFGELASHALVEAEARRLEQLRRSATAERIDGQIALGHHRDAIGELEATIRQDPLDERAHGQLMVAQYREGRQVAALETFTQLRERLREEMGVDPSPELHRLHERILRHDPELNAPTPNERIAGATGVATVASEAATATSDVTTAVSDTTAPASERPRSTAGPGLVGRDEEMAALVGLVGTTRLVTLIGPGGVGKTRLAEQVADLTAGAFTDGVVIAPLASVQDPGGVAPTILDALGTRQQGGRPADESLLAALRSRRVLLVLDNCEHVLPSLAPLVEAIVRGCPDVAVLATSREPLRGPGERVWQVAPLEVPTAHATAEQVRAAPACALFVIRAQAADASFSLTDEDVPIVAELCRRLDGIPLALELAAARISAMPARDLLDRIDQRFSLLTSGPHREAGRHRTLHAAIEWSYDALTDGQKRLFDRLSVFVGPFTLDAAEDVCADPALDRTDVAGLLAELVDRSMVTVDRRDGTRYRLLETLREFGATGLDASGDEEPFRRAHAAYHVAFAERHGPRIRAGDERAAVAVIDGAIDDLRVAHAWFVQSGDVDGALRLPTALRDYIGHRQRDEMITWIERALELPGAPEHEAYPAALATAARGAIRRGDLARARRYGEEAFERAESGSPAASWAVYALASLALYEGRLDDVLTLTEERVTLTDGAGEDYYQAMALMLRVLALQYRGDREGAIAETRELRVVAEASGNEAMRAWARYCQGEALLDTDPAAAVPALEEARAIARRAETRIPEGVAMVSLATLYSRTGELDRAIDLFAEVIVHWHRLGDWTHQLTTLRNLVELLVRLGEVGSAAVLHGAVHDASPPSFGDEAERLSAAWREIERQLGATAAAQAAERGRTSTPAQTIEEALATLARLRGR